MFSTRRRCTASSSAIKMLAAMAFPAHYNYLSRIGALWLMPINALLNVDLPPSVRTPQVETVKYRLQHDDLARCIRLPQVVPTPTPQEVRRKIQPGEAAGMEPGRSLFGHRRAGSDARPGENG